MDAYDFQESVIQEDDTQLDLALRRLAGCGDGEPGVESTCAPFNSAF